MNLYASLLSYGIALILGFGAGYRWQESNITQMELDHANERIATARTARATLERQGAQLGAAQTQAAGLAHALADDTVHAISAAGGVRNAADYSLRANSSSLAACVADTTTKSELLGDCAGAVIDMASKAQGHANDLEALSTAWPR